MIRVVWTPSCDACGAALDPEADRDQVLCDRCRAGAKPSALAEAVERTEGDYDTRYLGGWAGLVSDAMKTIDPSRDWSGAVERILAQEHEAGRLGREGCAVDWAAIETKIRGAA